MMKAASKKAAYTKNTLLATGVIVLCAGFWPLPVAAQSPLQQDTAPAAPESAAPDMPLPPAIGKATNGSGPASIQPPKEQKDIDENADTQVEIDPLAWEDNKSPTAPTPPAVAEPLPTETPMMPAPTAAAPAEKPTTTATAPTSTPAVSPTETPPTVVPSNGLDERLKALEKQVADLKAGMASKEDLQKLRVELKDTAGTVRPSAGKDIAGDAAPAAVKNTHKKSKKAAPKVRKPATGWILKSAKPGMAWVAQPGSSELKTVAVGDVLPGIGKIKSISLDSMGKWLVNGTTGYINQK